MKKCKHRYIKIQKTPYQCVYHCSACHSELTEEEYAAMKVKETKEGSEAADTGSSQEDK